MLSIAINRAEHACATVIIKHNYMLLKNHKIVINIMLCLLNSIPDIISQALHVWSTSRPMATREIGLYSMAHMCRSVVNMSEGAVRRIV